MRALYDMKGEGDEETTQEAGRVNAGLEQIKMS